MYCDGGNFHSRRLAPDSGADGMDLQRVHTGVRNFRNPKRMAGRHRRAKEGTDANRLMVVGIYGSHGHRVELCLDADIPVSLRSRRSRRVSELVTKLFAMV